MLARMRRILHTKNIIPVLLGLVFVGIGIGYFVQDTFLDEENFETASADTGVFTYSTTLPTISEGGAATTFSVVMTENPGSQPVTFRLTTDGETKIFGQNQYNFVFNQGNWDITQTVRIYAHNDELVEGSHSSTITTSTLSSNNTYDALTIDNITGSITDNDSVGIVLDTNSFSMFEDGTNRFVGVRLNSQPSAASIVELDYAFDSNEVTIPSSPTIQFDDLNWDEFQYIEIVSVDDLIVRDDVTDIDFTIDSVATTDANYQSFGGTETLTVSLLDNDYAGLEIDKNNLTLTEGSQAEVINVWLSSEIPSGETVSLEASTGNLETEVSLDNLNFASTQSFTITNANWDRTNAQKIYVRAIDDGDSEGSVDLENILIQVNDSDDPSSPYDVNNLSSITNQYTIPADVLDNDSLSYTTDGTAELSGIEGSGSPDTITLSTSQPIDNGSLLLDITFDTAQVTINGSSVSPEQITLTSASNTSIVNVEPVDDDIVESDTSNDTHQSSINITINNASTAENSSVPFPTTLSSDLDFTIYDNDTADFIINNFTDGTSAISAPFSLEEGVETLTYDIALSDQPLGDVFVRPINSDKFDINFDPTDGHDTSQTCDSSLENCILFTTLNWNAPQTVILDAKEDTVITGDVVEYFFVNANNENSEITYRKSSNQQEITFEDNDNAGVAVESLDLSNAPDLADEMTENPALNPIDRVGYTLTSEPTGNVTVRLTTRDGRINFSPSTLNTFTPTLDLTFNSSNWNIQQIIDVQAIDDQIDYQATYSSGISQNVISSDINYNNFNILDKNFTVTDNDQADVVIAQYNFDNTVVDSSNGVDEDNASTPDYIRVSLATQPIDSVFVTLNTDNNQLQMDGTGLTNQKVFEFNTSNWNVEQSIDVYAVDDAVVELDPHTSDLTFSVTSSNTVYDGILIPAQTFSIAENDTAGVIFNPGSLMIDEDSLTSSDIVLNLSQEPNGIVVVDVSVPNSAEVLLSQTSFTFDNTNWNDSSRILTVTPVDDNVDTVVDDTEIITFDVDETASGRDVLFDSYVTDFNVTLVDDDVAGITQTLLPANSTVVEDTPPDASFYTVALDSQPLSGEIVTVVLSMAPGILDLELSSDGVNFEAPGDPLQLTFDQSNQSRIVTFRAFDDIITEGPETVIISSEVLSTTASGSAYDQNPVITGNNVSVSVSDNDQPGYTVNPATLTIDEAEASDTFTVVLNTEPQNDVVVDIATDTDEVTSDKTQLTFTNSDWDDEQTVTLTSVEDVEVGDEITNVDISINSSSDSAYTSLPNQTVEVTITNNDLPGVEFTDDLGNTPFSSTQSIDESGAGNTITYGLRLTSKPRQNVYFWLNDDLLNGEFTFTPAKQDLNTGSCASIECFYNLIFTPSNWDQYQTFTLTAVDNDIDAPDNLVTVVHQNNIPETDPLYRPLTIDLDLTITDDDIAGIVLTNRNNSNTADDITPINTVDEAGGANASDFIRLVLESEPVNNVTIEATVPGEEITLGTTGQTNRTLTFTPTDWFTPQPIQINAKDDDFDEDDIETENISFTVTSTDGNYSPITISDEVVEVNDDDAVGVEVTPTLISMGENAQTSTFEVRLDSRPALDSFGGDQLVYLNISSSDTAEAGLDAGVLIFDSSNWNEYQDVTITSVDDDFDRDDSATITVSVDTTSNTDDTDFYTVSDSTIAVTLVDDDDAGISFNLSTVNVVEGGTEQNVLVSLDTEPLTGETVTAEIGINNAEVEIKEDDDLTYNLPGDTLIMSFDSTNYQNRIINIRADDDDDLESNHTSELEGEVTGSSETGSAYSGSGIHFTDTLTVNIADDDTASILLDDGGDGTSVSEQGSTVDTFTLGLSSNPNNTVSASITFDDTQITLNGDTTSPFETTFNNNSAQTISVQAIDDVVVETSNILTSINVLLSETGNGNDYDGLTTSAQIEVIDNDLPQINISNFNPTTRSVIEDGGEITFDVVLDTQPQDNVFVFIDAGPDFDVDQLLNSVPCGPGNSETCDYHIFFTDTNWNAPKPITLTAIDNDIDGPNSTYDLVLDSDLANSDPLYRVSTPTGVNIITSENDDTAGVQIVETGGDTTVTEVGANDTVEIVLNSRPLDTVTIQLSNTNSEILLGSGVESSATITRDIEPDDWDTPISVEVSAIDDNIQETGENDIISISSLSNDNAYDLTLPSVNVTVVDNDTNGLILDQTSLTLNENLGTRQVNVQLSAEPLVGETVTVAVTSQQSGNIDIDPTTLTFDNTDWNINQPVRIDGIDDNFDRDDADVIRFTPTNSYSSVIETVDVTLTDDDTAGFDVAPTQFTLNEANAGFDDYTISLTTQPLSGEEIELTIQENVVSNDPEIELSLNGTNFVAPGDPLIVIFNDTNWQGRQIFVRTIDDTDIEGFQDREITHIFETNTVSSAYNNDNNVPPIEIDDFTVTIIDDESASFNTNKRSIVMDEFDGSDTFTVTVSQEPSPGEVVELDVIVSSTDEITVDKTTLIFDQGNWNQGQVVTVDAVDDGVVRDDFATITLSIDSGSDPAYTSQGDIEIDVELNNDDLPGLLVENIIPASQEISENGGIFTVDVSLTAEPQDNVYLWAGNAVQGLFTIQPPELSSTLGGCNPSGNNCRYHLEFTPTNWMTPQTITFIAEDNNIDEADKSHPFSMTTIIPITPINYRLNADSITFTIIDDEGAGLLVASTDGTTAVEEGGITDEIRVTLKTEPVGDVNVNVIGDTQININGQTSSILTFTTSNWNMAQTVTISAIDDLNIEGPHTGQISFGVSSSSDSAYDVLEPTPLSVGITDNDIASYAPNKFAVEVAENGGSETVGISLGSQPASDVVINVTSGEPGDATVSVNQITITDQTWDDPLLNTFVITGVNDNEVGDSIFNVTLSVDDTASDPNFANLSDQTISVTVTNDDTVGIEITETGGTTIAAEGQEGLDTYRIDFLVRPSADVTVTITADNDLYLNSNNPGDPLVLVFTPQNYQTTRVVTVSAVDDDDQEGTHSGVISHTVSSQDGNYNGLVIDDITVDISDNEVPGVVLDSADNTTSEAGDIANVSFVLTSRPSTQVTIPVFLDDLSEGNLAGVTQITIEPENWDNPTTNFVAINGVDDEFDDGDVQFNLLTGAPVTSDASYAALTEGAVPNFQLVNEDDDVAGLNINVLDGVTTESGDTAEFTVALTSRPTSNVTIQLQSSDSGEGTVQSTLVIQPEEWSVPQSVIVTGVDDKENDDNQDYAILTNEVISTDQVYDALTGADVPDIQLINEDNEDVQISVSATTQQVTEDGQTATISFTLSKQPSGNANVTIPLSVDGSEGDIQGAVTSNTSLFGIQGFAASNFDLVIQNANWDNASANSVRIGGLNDPYIDGDQTFRVITGTTISDDPDFNGIQGGDIADLTFTNTDNDIDSDNDCSTDEQEQLDGTNLNSATSYRDTDSDEVPDGQELFESTNPNSATSFLDTDSDGVPDCVEQREGTNPTDPTSFLDSDNDGFSSYQERQQGTETPVVNNDGSGSGSGGGTGSGSGSGGGSGVTGTPRTGGFVFVPLGIVVATVGYILYKFIRRKWFGKR